MGRTYHSSVIKDSKIPPEVLPSVVSKQCAENVTRVTWDVAWLSKTPKYKSHENIWKLMDIFNQMRYFLNLKWPQVVGNPSMLGSRSDTVEAADLRPRALYVELLHTLVKLSRPGGFVWMILVADKLIVYHRYLRVGEPCRIVWRVGLWKPFVIFGHQRWPEVHVCRGGRVDTPSTSTLWARQSNCRETRWIGSSSTVLKYTKILWQYALTLGFTNINTEHIMNTSILLMQWDYIYALPAGYLSRALALTFNSTSPDHQKKNNWARKVRQRRPWKSEWNLFLPQTIQDCHHLRTGFIPFLQASHRPRFRWLLNWCEPYRARSRSSGGSGFDFCPSKMVDFEPILIFWKHPDMVFLFPKGRVSLIFSGTLRFRSVPMKSTHFRFRYLCATAGALGVLQACPGTQLGDFRHLQGLNVWGTRATIANWSSTYHALEYQAILLASIYEHEWSKLLLEYLVCCFPLLLSRGTTTWSYLCYRSLFLPVYHQSKSSSFSSRANVFRLAVIRTPWNVANKYLSRSLY